MERRFVRHHLSAVFPPQGHEGTSVLWEPEHGQGRAEIDQLPERAVVPLVVKMAAQLQLLRHGAVPLEVLHQSRGRRLGRRDRRAKGIHPHTHVGLVAT